MDYTIHFFPYFFYKNDKDNFRKCSQYVKVIVNKTLLKKLETFIANFVNKTSFL